MELIQPNQEGRYVPNGHIAEIISEKEQPPFGVEAHALDGEVLETIGGREGHVLFLAQQLVLEFSESYCEEHDVANGIGGD